MKITTTSYKKGSIKCNLRKIRTKLGITQVELARRAGTTQQTLSAIESGSYNPSVILALGLAACLNCKVEDIFEFDQNQDWVYGNLLQMIKENQGAI